MYCSPHSRDRLWKLFLEARMARKSAGAGHSQWDPRLDSGHTEREGPWCQSSVSWRSCLMIPPISSLISGVSLNLRTSDEEPFSLTSPKRGSRMGLRSIIPEPISGTTPLSSPGAESISLDPLIHRDMPRLIASAVQCRASFLWEQLRASAQGKEGKAPKRCQHQRSPTSTR